MNIPLSVIRGTVHRLGDDVNTDLHCSAKYNIGKPVEWLARQVALARAIGALETIDADRAAIAAGDALAAFDAVRPAIDAVADPARKREVLRGLFGPRGPNLYAQATAVHEGIDHAWVFRYETEEPGL